MVKKKYYLLPLGCAQNISDAERVATVLEEMGFSITSEESEADLICVLACSVRQSAIDRIYGRSKIWRKYKKKSLKILSGCVLPKDKPKMEGIFDIIFEIKNLNNLQRLINNYQLTINPTTALKAGKQIQNKNDRKKNLEIKNFDNGYFSYLSINPKHTNSFQALVPIMNGCNNFCSYCAVPYTRGREVSRPMEEILTESKDLILANYKEITLLGQNVNSYGTENSKQLTTNKESFLELLKRINKIPGKFWIRFISNHPKDFSDELIKTLSKLEKVTPYIHLPLQSGSNKILKAMNRKYTREDYLKLVEKIRKNLPNVAISTDTIVGFPGETEDDFKRTIDLFKKVGFDMAYISQYSPRSGTLATRLVDDVSKEEKKRRDKELTEVLGKTALKNNQKYIGKTVEILVEKYYKDFFWGRTNTYKLVKFAKGPTLSKNNGDLAGKFVKIKIESATPWLLKGNLQ